MILEDLRAHSGENIAALGTPESSAAFPRLSDGLSALGEGSRLPRIENVTAADEIFKNHVCYYVETF